MPAPAVANTPQWGRSLRKLWRLDEGVRLINHGAFGAAPLEILAEQSEWRARMERNTARFFMTELPKALRRAAGPTADFVGTSPERLAFVANATTGINAVARSLHFERGDEIILTDHTYNAVRNVFRHIADRSGAVLVEAKIGVPVTGQAQILDAVAAGITDRTRLVVIDHVASASAVEHPVAAIVAMCRDRGIRVLVDGAHAPGLLDLDVDAIDADWYVGNFHKWVCAPKGAAFLAVSRRPTPHVHPLSISHAYGQTFPAEFDKIGTQDATAILSVPSAIAFHQRLGGTALRARNRDLARRVALRVARELGSETGADASLFHAMATIRLPVDIADHPDAITRLHDHLYDHSQTEAAISRVAGTLYLRVSVQAYNDCDDYEGLAQSVSAAIAALEPAADPHQFKGTP
jgi:isopenicillin-N epimerase